MNSASGSPVFLIFSFKTNRYHTVRGWSASPDFAYLLSREEAETFIAAQPEPYFLVPVHYDPRTAHQDIQILGHKRAAHQSVAFSPEMLNVAVKAAIELKLQTSARIATKLEKALARFDIALDGFRKRVQDHERSTKAIPRQVQR